MRDPQDENEGRRLDALLSAADYVKYVEERSD